MPPHRVGLWRLFGLKMGIHFAHFGRNRLWFSRELRSVWTYLFNSIWLRKIEKYANSKLIWIIFCLRYNLSNDNIISTWNPGLKTGTDFRRLVWKRVRKITFFGLKSGEDLKNRAAHLYQEFLGVPPPPAGIVLKTDVPSGPPGDYNVKLFR